jgi:hypothetical protein
LTRSLEGYAEPCGELDHLSGNRGDRGDRVGRLDLSTKQLTSSDDSGESSKYGALDSREDFQVVRRLIDLPKQKRRRGKGFV